jgi:nucleoside-diphosphate-sugar epimerase
MKIVVTGGAGYVGSHLVPRLAAAGHDLVVLDRIVYGQYWPTVPANGGEVQYIAADIRDESALAAALHGAQAVIHLAGLPNDPDGRLESHLTTDINTTASLRLLGLAQRHGIGRFIFASSASVYGRAGQTPLSEEALTSPLTAYARSKAVVEQEVIRASSAVFTTVALRPATLCGYAPRMRFDLLLNGFAKQAWFEQRIEIHGPEHVRPLLSVIDMSRVYEAVLTAGASSVSGRVFNVASTHARAREMAELARDIVNPRAQIVILPEDDPRHYLISTDAIRRSLGFVPSQTLEDVLQELRQAFASGLISDPDQLGYYSIATLTKDSSAVAVVPRTV